MKKIAFLSIIILFNFSVFCQPTLQQANELYQKAQQNLKEGKINDAIDNFENAAVIFQQNGDEKNAIISRVNEYDVLIKIGKINDLELKLNQLNSNATNIFGENTKIVAYTNTLLGRYWFMMNDTEKAIFFLNKSLQINKILSGEKSLEYANALQDYALLLYQVQMNDSALICLNKVLEIYTENNATNSPNIVNIYFNIGNVLMTIGQTDNAIEIFLKILDILKSQNMLKSEQTAKIYTSLGNAYTSKKDFVVANDYFEKSNSILKEIYSEDSFLIVDNYINQGNMMYYQNNFEFALQYYFLATKQQEKNSQNPTNLISLYNNIGLVYTQTMRYSNAITFFEKALDLKKQYYTNEDEQSAIIYTNMGTVYQKLNNYNSALQYFNKAKDIMLNIYGFNYPTLTKTMLNIANLYFENQKYDTAQIFFQYAILTNQIDTTFYKRPDYYRNTNVYSKTDLLEAINGILYLHLIDKQKNSDINRLAELEPMILFADSIIDQIRFEIITDEDKMSINEQMSSFFQNTIFIFSILLDNTKNKEFTDKIFYFIEKNKSSTLLSNISSENYSEDSLFQKYLDTQKYLKEKIRIYNQQIATSNDFKKNDFYRQLIIETNQEIEKNNQQFKRNQSNFNVHYSSMKASKIYEIQSIIDDSTALINYYLSDDFLLAIVITKSEYNSFEIRIDKNFFQTINDFKRTIVSSQKQDFGTYLKSAFDLYNYLFFFTLPSKIKKLLIIPHLDLITIPFDALLTQKIEKIDTKFSDLPYLINNYSISYSYSASLFKKYYLTDYSSIERNDLLTFAPVFKSDNPQQYKGSNVSTILGTEKEATDIYNLFISKNLKSTKLLNNKANEYLFKLILKSNDYKIIHIATHGLVDYENPNLSALVLSRDSMNVEDGLVFAGEISNISLHSELVILSACETAQGKLFKGEGVVGLAYSFLSAGAKNLIISLWKVSDEATVELMYNFYSDLLTRVTNLNNCHSFNESLTKSKRKIIKSKYSHPYFWAAFVLIGM